MKTLLILAALSLNAGSAQAAKLEILKEVNNAGLKEALAATDSDVLANAFKIALATPAKGRSAADVRKATVAQAAHTLCATFDDGVTLKLTKDAAGAVRDLQIPDESKTKTAQLTQGLEAAARDSSIELYSGYAAGNNTAGSVVGAYDLKNEEVVVFATTNCGSDN